MKRELPHDASHDLFPCMKRPIAVVLFLSIFALAGCGYIREFQEKRYSNHNEKGYQWLSDQMLPPEINVSGNWNCPDWGKSSFLAQDGAKVGGHLGDYPVEGVVSGKQLFLLIGSGGWFYYSAILEAAGDNMLIGYYSRTIPYKSSGKKDLRLDRRL